MPGLKPVTLVTGASAGIGAALAAAFAEKGHDLVLVARRASRLDAVADRIAGRGHSRPSVIAVDLTQPDATERIGAQLRERGLEPANVVNSAGFGMLGPAASLDRERQLAMIDLNVRVTTDLSLRFIDSLVRHRGGILNLGSVLGFMPGPGMAVYHATKAYILSFSEALHHELKPRGVRVTVLCPGPVETEFAVRPEGFFSRGLVRTVEQVTRHGVEGFMQGRCIVVPGKHNKVLSLLPRLLPRGTVLAMVKLSKRRTSDAEPQHQQPRADP